MRHTSDTSMIGQRIGRFDIQRELGKGGQGMVYLARDTQLDRLVAIKTLHKLSHRQEALMHEARIVSKLQHPNIITLYDSGEHLGAPYLVYAYIEGETLAQLLRREQRLSFVRAAEIACGVLDGLAYAHAQGISHLDVKPANVMIAANGIAMLMDFGLSSATGSGQPAPPGLSGTPRYIAPELISGQRSDPQADIYSTGVMLYEMVTGEFAVEGQTIHEVLNRAAHAQIAAPSSHNERLDEKLEAIILKAVAKNPVERYPGATAMRQALRDYLGASAPAKPQGGTHGTLEFMLRRMRSKSDFPILSNTISEINKIVASESESTTKLTRAILQDFALTNKLLKLVNTASYGHFGGTINTISKAVVILGFETVRNIAMSLILLEFLQNKPQAAQLRDELVQALFSGIVAAQLSVGNDIRDAEEIMICAMFHNLGRMLTTFYFFEESQDIARLIEQGESEDQASAKVLGLTYAELGLGVARTWNFPPRLMAGIRKLPPGDVAASVDDTAQLTIAVNLANDLCETAMRPNAPDGKQVLHDLSQRYGAAFKVSPRDLAAAIDTGLSELTRRAATLGIAASRSQLVKHMQKLRSPAAPRTAADTTGREDVMEALEHSVADLSRLASPDPAQKPKPEAVLGAGIQDVTASLVSEFDLNNILQMILETIYRGMRFRRALFMLRDNKQSAMAARFGFGEDINAIIPKFRFPLTFAPDVFHLALDKGLDIAIENIGADNIADKVPEWYKASVNAPCFMLLPVKIKDKAIGLFYADMPEPNSLNLSEQQLSLLRTLRNQAVLAIKQKI